MSTQVAISLFFSIAVFLAVFFAVRNYKLYKAAYSLAEENIKLEDLINKESEKIIAEEESWKTIQITEIDEPMIFEYLKKYKHTLEAVRFERIPYAHRNPKPINMMNEHFFKFSVKLLEKTGET